MAKISKNAKKLLALTLAGVMTVGTAVPGTVVSSVQEVKAADYNVIDENSTVDEVLENVVDAFSKWQPTGTTVFVKGDSYNPTDTSDKPTGEISSFIKDELGWTADGDNVYTQNGFSLTVSPNTYADGIQQVVNNVTFTVSKDGKSDSRSADLKGIYFYNSQTTVDTLGTLDLSEVAIDSTDNEKTIATKVEEYVVGKINAFIPENVTDSKVKVDATVSMTAEDTSTITYTVSKVEVTCGEDVVKEASIKNTSFKVERVASDEAKEALAKLQSELTTVEVGDASIDATNDVAKEIQTAIEKKANEILADTDYTADIVDDSDSIVTKGNWTGKITVQKGNDSITGSFNLKLVQDAEEDSSIVKIELVEPKSEVEYGSKLADAVKLRLTRADGSVEVTTSDDSEITFDKAGLDTEKQFNALGSYSVTFHTTDAETTPVATFTTTVVNTIKDGTDDGYTDGKLGVTEDKYSTVTSSDTSILAPGFEADGTFYMKALKTGTVTLTAISKNGATYVTKAAVKSDGSVKLGDPELQLTDRVVVNSAAEIGFVATSVKSTEQTPTGLESDTVAKAELSTVNGVKVIRITPVSKGTAKFEVTGGVNGKLKNEITVEVDADGNATLTYTQKTISDLTATTSTASKLSKLVISTEGLKDGIETPYDLDKLGLDADDKLAVTTSDKVSDLVPVTDVDKVTVTYNETDNTIALKFNYGTADYTVTLGQNTTMVPNTVEKLGIVATKVVSIENTGDASALEENWFDAEITEDSEGNPIVLVTKGKEASSTSKAEITVSDDNGLETVLKVSINSGNIKVNSITKPLTGKKITAVAPEKRTYTLGEKVDADGGYFTYTTDSGAVKKVSLTSEMLGIDTSVSTYNYASATDTYSNTAKDITVAYGGSATATAQKSSEDANTATYTVKPATTSVSSSKLGLASDEKIISTAFKGDVNDDYTEIIVTLDKDGKNLSVAALQTEKSGSVVLTTNKGNSISVAVAVDENGALTAEVVKAFKSSIKTVKNDEETLGFVATEASSDNTNVALVTMAGDKLTITSVAPGNATITATDGNNYAKIDVTVDEFGTITINNIDKVGEDGWVRGEGSDWYYYINGEKVTNDWVAVEEADPYNNNQVGKVWYHFDKDGKMQRGWIKDESGWKIYNLDSNGRMRHDMWINAEANDELGMPTGIYHLLSDGAAQMNGWAESITEGIYWFCAPNSGVFDASNPANWATSMPK